MALRLGALSVRAVVYMLLIIFTLIAVVPVIWLVAAALKSKGDIFKYLFFAPRLTMENFHDLFLKSNFFRYMLNSVFITCLSVVVQLFFSSLGGFALAKYEFKGKKIIMIIMLATMMIPFQVTLAPLYELTYRLHLVDSYAGLIVPSAVSVFGIFLFRQSILQVSDELIHAARIDGCSEFRIFWDIVMPITRPMTGAFCLIAFMGAWNNFLWPQIILHSYERFTLPIGLAQLVGLYQQQYGMLMAGTLLSILPVVVLFMLLQKEFVAGLTAGAVKG